MKENKKITKVSDETESTAAHKDEDLGSFTFKFTKKTFRYIAGAAVFFVLLYWGLNNTEKVSSVLNKILTVTEPFVLGFCIAFVINVLMRPLEKLWDRLLRKKQTKHLGSLSGPYVLF